MVSVQTVNLKSQNSEFAPIYLTKKNSNPSFGRGKEEFVKKFGAEILDDTERKVKTHHKWIAAISGLFNDTSGEIQNQLGTAVFTTTLAPLFIAYNPFTHQDEKSRHYTAWRQPLSAVVSLALSLPLTMWTDKMVSHAYNQGICPTMDLRMSPNKDYYKDDFNKAYNEAKKAGGKTFQEFISAYEPEDISVTLKDKNKDLREGKVGAKPSFFYKKALLSGYVKKQQEKRLNIFTQLISAKPNTIKIQDGVITIAGKAINKDSKTGIVERIPKMETQEELNKFLTEQNLHSRTMGDFMSKKFKFELYGPEDGTILNGKFKPEIIKESLQKVTAMDYLRNLGIIDDSVTEAELLKTILTDRQIKHAKDYAKALHISEDDAIRAEAIMGQDTSRNIQMARGEIEGKKETLGLGQFFHQIGYKVEDGSLQKLMDSNMAKGMEDLKTLFTGKKKIDGKVVDALTGFKETDKLPEIAKRMLKKYSDEIGKLAGNNKKFTGAFFNLFITGTSCTVLNWVYPRFMAKFRPNLCPQPAESAKKGGNE